MFSPFEGDTTIEDTIKIAPLLEKAGIDLLDPSGACQKITKVVGGKKYDHLTSTCPPNWPEGHEVKFVAQLKKAVKIPVIVVGKIYSPQLAENILELEQADLVALGRSLIADPGWPRKVREGREREIMRCKEDLKCLRVGGPIQCVVNKSLPPEGIDVLA
jgi:2,4-dienoyl-CoA reductase-like NADH-dependent reductase (Old Yellow Enzyme family)